MSVKPPFAQTWYMLRKIGYGLALLGMLLVEVPLVLAMLLAAPLMFGIGLVPLFPPVVRGIRRVAGRTRRQVTEWCGVEIEDRKSVV